MKRSLKHEVPPVLDRTRSRRDRARIELGGTGTTAPCGFVQTMDGFSLANQQASSYVVVSGERPVSFSVNGRFRMLGGPGEPFDLGAVEPAKGVALHFAFDRPAGDVPA